VTGIRELRTIAECRGVVGIQEAVWGTGSEIVPASVLAASIRRGGILLGAFEEDMLVGFVWSMPGWRDGAPTQWSHMLGVRPEARGRRLGERLKLAQRERALASPAELIEWTFDPLQAPNAHLNLAVLGCVATTYLVDAYGDMPGPLHRGTATDRLIAEWWIRRPHVERRVARRSQSTSGGASLVARSDEVLSAPATIEVVRNGGRSSAPGAVHTTLTAKRVVVPVPAGFTALQRDAPDAARAWRHATRDVFLAYFARGYRGVDFFLDRASGAGQYLLAADS
jgi:chorismate synthase